jgi:hypothetical protein
MEEGMELRVFTKTANHAGHCASQIMYGSLREPYIICLNENFIYPVSSRRTTCTCQIAWALHISNTSEPRNEISERGEIDDVCKNHRGMHCKAVLAMANCNPATYDEDVLKQSISTSAWKWAKT